MSFMQRSTRPRIRPPKSRLGAGTDFDATWAKLERTIREIHRKNASDLSYEELYRAAYTLVLHGHGTRLYENVTKAIQKHLEQCVSDQLVTPIGPGDTAPRDERPPIDTTTLSLTHRLKDNQSFLTKVTALWDDHVTSMSLIKDILMYMDRVYCPRADVPQTYHQGLILFRKHVLNSPQYAVQKEVHDQMLECITTERRGGEVDRSLLARIRTMLVSIPPDGDSSFANVYFRDFENLLEDNSRQYYRQVGSEWANQMDANEFLMHISNALQHEDTRCDHYLVPETKPKLATIIHEELIKQYAGTIIGMPHGLRYMMEHKDFTNLRTMYNLFTLHPSSTEELRQACSEFIQQQGLLINARFTSPESGAEATTKPRRAPGVNPKEGQSESSDQSPLQWVPAVLEFKQQIDKVLTEAFGGDNAFEKTLLDAFAEFVNQYAKAPEVLSLFMDEHLSKNTKGKTEEENDAILGESVVLFRHLRDKDIFERYYKQHLARRLLLGRSVSEDAERRVISKLKVERGYHFTSKLEGMFNDVRISADTNQAFHQHLTSTEVLPLGYQLNVQVLTASLWPVSVTSQYYLSTSKPQNEGESPSSAGTPWTPALSNTSGIILSPELLQGVKCYTQFYLDKHSGRKLAWQLSMGHVDLRCQFKAKRYQLNVTLFQALVLLHLNQVADDTLVTFQTLQEETGVPEYDLRRNLRALACGKFKILVKEPKSSDINPETDRFKLNTQFAAPQSKIRIRAAPSSGTKEGDGISKKGAAITRNSAMEGRGLETESEARATQAQVEETRRTLVEATIVRIMKSRKQLDHSNLLTEVTEQLQSRFMAKPAMIKQRIEFLIDRDYLERSADDRRVYNYLA
ncbi:hypothetical protein IWQ62_001447 [Dispira parvispora]|uniref:Cullin family profile domain-containing protein n=1 Tax=Dispira parvispora TaxID=1520584 RepID=A0A9W8AV04_9FUNG|nr:hypothetical protein IWQ62_001447 [Dispira parvispora]